MEDPLKVTQHDLLTLVVFPQNLNNSWSESPEGNDRGPQDTYLEPQVCFFSGWGPTPLSAATGLPPGDP